MLDKLPAWLRHAAISLGATAALALIDHYQTGTAGLGLPPAAAVALAAVLPTLALWLTPLTRQYGVGADTAPDDTQA